MKALGEYGIDAVSSPRGRQLIEPLSKRELDVLALVCDGLSNEEISEAMGVTLATVKWHLINAYGKMGVKRRTQAVALAIFLELIRPDWLHGKAEVVAVPPQLADRRGRFWQPAFGTVIK